MSDLKPTGTMIKLGGKDYGLLFSLNAIDDIQEKLEVPISKIGDLLNDEMKSFKAIRVLLSSLINAWIEAEDRDDFVTEKWVGSRVNVGNIEEIRDSIFASFADSLPEEEDENPKKG